jgi:transmembrane sensor
VNSEEKKYRQYLVEDFIWDEDFRGWVHQPTDVSNLFWSNWLATNPDKENIVETAKHAIKALLVENVRIGESEIAEEIDQILLRTASAGFENVEHNVASTNEQRHVSKLKNRYFSPNVFLRVAAVFLLFMGIGLTIYYRGNNETSKIATEYGSIKKITLPDSSTIVLNGNSNISFRKHWKHTELREIWLEGEGFFNVQHLDKDNKITEHERFLVHVKDVTVEVLGTSFDIRSRRNKTEIVLKSGKIKLAFKDKGKRDIIMKPFDIVSIDADNPGHIGVSTTQPEQYTSWIHKKLLLNNSSFEEVIQYIEDNYGRKIVLDNSALKSRRIEGTIMLDNLDDALFVLSKVLNVKVIKNDSTIYFMSK